MKYETLKSGDVRNQGDEVRSLIAPNNQPQQAEWHKTDLVGHEILQSDLAHLELRRLSQE